ncbi:hypothetical protein ACQCVK_05090 [Rossellomorea vietnamensis]
MTVEELIELLSKMPKDAKVIVTDDIDSSCVEAYDAVFIEEGVHIVLIN